MDTGFQVNSTNSSCTFLLQKNIFLPFFEVTLSILGLPVISRHFGIAFSTSSPDILNLNICVLGMVQCLYQIVVSFLNVFLPWLLTRKSYVMMVLGFMGSSSFMCVICVERFVAVVRPMYYSQLKMFRFREVCCAGIWVVVLQCFLWIALAGASLGVIEVKISLVCLLAFNTAIIITCNINISLTLRRSGPGRDAMHPIKLKAYWTIRRISVIIWCCYVPTAVLSFSNINLMWSSVSRCTLAVVSSNLPLAASILYSLLTLRSKGRLWPFSLKWWRRGLHTSQ